MISSVYLRPGRVSYESLVVGTSERGEEDRPVALARPSSLLPARGGGRPLVVVVVFMSSRRPPAPSGPAGVRNAYASHVDGAAGHYRDAGASYANPHEPGVREMLRAAVEAWPTLWAPRGGGDDDALAADDGESNAETASVSVSSDRILDLSCGSGEVTLALRDAGVSGAFCYILRKNVLYFTHRPVSTLDRVPFQLTDDEHLTSPPRRRVRPVHVRGFRAPRRRRRSVLPVEFRRHRVRGRPGGEAVARRRVQLRDASVSAVVLAAAVRRARGGDGR